MKDYAKRIANRKKTTNPVGKLKTIFISLFFIIIFGTISYGYLLKKINLNEINSSSILSWVSQAKLFFHHQTAQPNKVLTKNNSVATREPTSEVKFDFYSELPASKVSVSTIQTPTPAPQVLISRYILQLGIYKNQAEASQARLSLLLSGVDAVVALDAADKPRHDKGVYRLQQGPFPTLAEAKQIQQQLQKKGISSIIKTDQNA